MEFCESVLLNQTPGGNHTIDHDPDPGRYVHDRVKWITLHITLPIICITGILGNLLNMIILRQKRLKSTMDCMEKAALMGLVSLAVSDMTFCVVTLPQAFEPDLAYYTSKSFWLYYRMYRNALINTMLMTSTWLTVVMTSWRYLAICHPLHARAILDLRSTRIAISIATTLSLCFNIPSFFKYRIKEIDIGEGCVLYLEETRELYTNHGFKFTYQIIWAILGVFVPLFVLTACNICLIRALRQSARQRRMYGRNQPALESQNRLTPTLVSIVILFTVLVCPSEILKFKINLNETITSYNELAAMHITNQLQAINYAINFILYYAINIQFRSAMKEMFSCFAKIAMFKSSYSHATVSLNMSDLDTDT